jgi:hypothetical protein
MKTNCFQGYKLCPNYRYIRIWHFALGPGPIPLAKGELVMVSTLRYTKKGATRRERYDYMRNMVKRCNHFDLPPFKPTTT